MAETTKKPKIEKVVFGIPSSQFGVLGSKGLSLSSSRGEIFWGGGSLILKLWV